MTDQDNRFENMFSILRERGFRITPQRIAVLKIIARSEGHPSIDNIYEQVRKDFPTTSIATVYKTVTVLKGLDQVLELGFPEGSNRYDGNNPFPHPHLICSACKNVMDLDMKILDGVTEALTSETGFQITSHRLDFFGLCPACREKED